MDSGISNPGNWDTTADFRSKATLWVAVAAVLFLLPIAVLDFVHQRPLIGIGSLFIVTFLIANVLIIKSGRCHQNWTLFGLVPAGMIFMIGVFLDDGIVGSVWCYPAILACYCMLSARRAWLANGIILGFSLPMAVMTLPAEHAYRIIATQLAMSTFAAILVSVIDRQRTHVYELLIHDPLTGLLNRFTLKDTLTKAINAFKDDARPSSLLALDIDHFKQINDLYGHDVGDRALTGLGKLLVQNLRAGDNVFRLGGEELLILLDNLDEKHAHNMAKRIRRLIEQAPLVPHTNMTVSIGLADCARAQNWNEWMKEADDSLYQAKRQGRNQVVVAGRNPDSKKREPGLAGVTDRTVVTGR